jgi:carboxyl-terminal processing protease
VQRFVPKLILPCALVACGADPGSIGAVLAQSRSDGRLTVRDTPSGHPAAAAGIAPGDEILLIDGRDVRNLSPDAVHRLLQGDVGTTVNLTVLRRGKIERIAVERAPLAPSEPR